MSKKDILLAMLVPCLLGFGFVISKEALATYSASKGRGKPTIDASEALKILEEKLSVARDLLYPVDWSDYKTKALQLLPECIDHVLELEDGRKRYCDVVLQMTKAFAFGMP